MINKNLRASYSSISTCIRFLMSLPALPAWLGHRRPKVQKMYKSSELAEELTFPTYFTASVLLRHPIHSLAPQVSTHLLRSTLPLWADTWQDTKN